MHPTPDSPPATLVSAPVSAPVSVGELLDKITILEIKSERIADPKKLENVNRERAALEAVVQASLRLDARVRGLVGELRAVNMALWDVEDALREHEARQDFGSTFVELARSVYKSNDRRAALKNTINSLTGSSLCEEKSYRGL